MTNGSGKTNGSGRTNGTRGRTNGTGGSGAGLTQGLLAVRARNNRRKAAAGVAVFILLGVGAFAALGMAGASTAAAVDGHFAEWDGRTVRAPLQNGAGLAAFGFQAMRSGSESYLEFAQSPFAGRTDVWLFLDEDLNPGTGYWDGSVGADSAVRVSGQGGRVMATVQYRFAGTDRFDLNSLVPSGSARGAAENGRIEFSVPATPQAFSVSVAQPDGAVTTGALLPGGTSATFSLPSGPALSNQVRNGIRIDGSFADWAGVSTTSDGGDAAVPARLDLLRAAAIGDDQSAQFYLETRGGALSGTLPLRAERLGAPSGQVATTAVPPRRLSGTDLFELYLDTDLSAGTGAPVEGIGADLMLRVEGTNGKVVSTQLFNFAPSKGWTVTTASAEAAAAGSQLEAAVVLPGLVGARAKFVLVGFEGVHDSNDQPIEVGRQAGALAPVPSAPAPTTRSEPLVTPVPEFGEVAGIAVAVAGSILLVRRRRVRAQVGSVSDAE